MSKQLPQPSNLRQLKTQAKDLRRALEARDPEALQRCREHHPRHRESSDLRLVEAGLTLQDAQLVIAREYGFDSWPKLAAAVGGAHEHPQPADEIAGSSEAAQQLRAAVARAAAADVPVLLTGAKGTGKRLAARTIHALSRRSSGPFEMTVDAADGLLGESELFGHEPGAFTGANSTREGNLQAAAGGTLVLAEIGGLSVSAQARLQQFVDSGAYRRLGGSQELAADLRLIGTSSRDLRELVEAGTFREDLYYQIGVLRIDLPPLRERAEDIPVLATHFAVRLCRGHREVPQFSQEALTLLEAHDWPGNVRELRNAVERAVAETPGETVLPDAVRL